jgi:hypothetical protein
VLLTIPVDAGDPQHFSAPKIEADFMYSAFAGWRCRCDATEPQQWRRVPLDPAWIAPSCLVFQLDDSTTRLPILAEHEVDNPVRYLLLRHRRELLLVDAADEPTKTQNRNPITERARFPHLVGDENDGDALSRSRFILRPADERLEAPTSRSFVENEPALRAKVRA